MVEKRQVANDNNSCPVLVAPKCPVRQTVRALTRSAGHPRVTLAPTWPRLAVVPARCTPYYGLKYVALPKNRAKKERGRAVRRPTRARGNGLWPRILGWSGGQGGNEGMGE